MDTLYGIWDAIKAGGSIMFVLAALSYVLYWQIISLLLYVMNMRLHELEARDRSDIKALAESRTDDPSRIQWEILMARYEDILWTFRDFLRNRLRFAGALLVAAPLLGLLGTVLGMLEMFEGLSMKAGHQTTVLVAEGVKKSLITTQTGLTIAIPALFFIYWIRSVSNRRELELLERKVIAAENGGLHNNHA